MSGTPESVLGPWVIGAFVDVFLQGILSGQIHTYFKMYKDDGPLLRSFVGGLTVLTTLKTIQSVAIVWLQNIVFFADYDGAVLLQYTTWWQAGHPLIAAALCLYTESYFCWRLYAVSKRWWIVLPVVILFLFSFASICIATYMIFSLRFDHIARWFAAHLASVFVADLLLTSLMAFFLLRTKKQVLPQTEDIIKSLIALTWMSAAPASVCAMLNLIFSQVYEGTDNITSTAFNMALPKIYAIAMMFTLNARKEIRARTLTSSQSATSQDQRDLRNTNLGRVRGDNNIELGIRVTTQEQTQVDVKNMFASPAYAGVRGKELEVDRKHPAAV